MQKPKGETPISGLWLKTDHKPHEPFTLDSFASCFVQPAQALCLIVVKDRFLAITSGSHMIKCARILDAQRPGHAVVLRQTGIDAMLDLYSAACRGR